MTVRPSIAVCLLLGLAAPSLAQEFRLEARTFPRPLLGPDGKPDVVIEASGVEPIGDDGRLALVAHDKAPAPPRRRPRHRHAGRRADHLAEVPRGDQVRPEVGGDGPRLARELLRRRLA